MTNVSIIGLDIAKMSFALHGYDSAGRTVVKKALKRAQVVGFFAQLPPARVALEACASAHYWAREITKLGHEARLIPAARVKRFAGRQKNDAADAKAIALALRDPETRFVSVKTVEQQSHLMLFKARDLLVMQRTQLINALRGHFGEIGIVVPQGPRQVYQLVDLAMQDEGELPAAMKEAMKALISALSNVSEEITNLERRIAQAGKSDARAKRLAEVPGIGNLTAMVLSAAIPDFHAFKDGREFAAYLGLVPKQHTTGGRPRLGSITRMGNRDIRRLLVVGSIAILARFKHNAKGGGLGEWARKLLEAKPFRLVAVALANKLARIAWAIMTKDAAYNPDHRLKTA
jgi:transposase